MADKVEQQGSKKKGKLTKVRPSNIKYCLRSRPPVISPHTKVPLFTKPKKAPPAVEKMRQAREAAEPPDMSTLTLAEAPEERHDCEEAVSEMDSQGFNPRLRSGPKGLTPLKPPAKMPHCTFTADEPLEASCVSLSLSTPSEEEEPEDGPDDLWSMLNSKVVTPARPPFERSQDVCRPLFGQRVKSKKLVGSDEGRKVMSGSGDEIKNSDEYPLTPFREYREDLRHRKNKRIPDWATGENLVKSLWTQHEYFGSESSAIFPPCPTNWVPFPEHHTSPLRDDPPTPVRPEDKVRP